MAESPRVPNRADAGEPGPRRIRDTTRNLIEAVLMDVWPRQAAIVDFGLDSQEHLEALYDPLRHGEITPEQVDAAIGDGKRLTELVNAAPHNPHKGIEFRTSWDDLFPEPDREAGNDRPSDGHHEGAGTIGKGTYQVWQDRGWPQSRINQMLGGWPPSRFPEEYVHVANVQAEGLDQAVALTTDTGDFLAGDGQLPWQPWSSKEGVQALVKRPFARDTDIGDVIVDPQGQAHRVEGKGFSAIGATRAHIPSPGEIADDDRLGSPEPDHGRDNGRGREWPDVACMVGMKHIGSP